MISIDAQTTKLKICCFIAFNQVDFEKQFMQSSNCRILLRGEPLRTNVLFDSEAKMASLMQLIKLVLDELYPEVEARNDGERDELIRRELEALSDDYMNLLASNRQPIDLRRPETRFAYIYKYTIAHADYVRQVISSSRPLAGLLDRPSVEMACLGGGPGSDFLGVLKYMNQNRKSTTVACSIYDRERLWGESWLTVAQKLSLDFHFVSAFQSIDVTVQADYEGHRKLVRADLFTLIYFMSEVYSFSDRAEPFFRHVMTSAKPRALFLYMDNRDRSDAFAGWFERLASCCGLVVLEKHPYDMAFGMDEEKRDLEPYFSKFDWMKRKSEVCYIVAEKR